MLYAFKCSVLSLLFCICFESSVWFQIYSILTPTTLFIFDRRPSRSQNSVSRYFSFHYNTTHFFTLKMLAYGLRIKYMLLKQHWIGQIIGKTQFPKTLTEQSNQCQYILGTVDMWLTHSLCSQQREVLWQARMVDKPKN